MVTHSWAANKGTTRRTRGTTARFATIVSPLRIALVARAFPLLSETFIRDLVRKLEERGHEVDVYSLYVPAHPPPGDSPGNWDVRYLIGPKISVGAAALRASARLFRCLASPSPLIRLLPLVPRQPRIAAEIVHAIPRLQNAPSRYDVIHAHFGPTGLLAVALRQIGVLRGAVVTTFHGFDITRYPHEKGTGAYDTLFAAGDWFTVNSNFSHARLTEFGAPEQRIAKIPMGIEPSRFDFPRRSRQPAEPLRLLSVGRLEPVKGLAFGLRAVARLVDEGHDVRYSIVGTGRLEAELRAEAGRLGIESIIRFTGPLPFDEVIEEYGSHHIFLMPGVVAEDGQVEAQGRVLVEAQAAGMPVIATRVGGIPETLADGAGVLVPPEDPEALAGAVVELARHPAQWPEMGARGRRHVEENYHADRLVNELVNVYRSAIGRVVGTGLSRVSG